MRLLIIIKWGEMMRYLGVLGIIGLALFIVGCTKEGESYKVTSPTFLSGNYVEWGGGQRIDGDGAQGWSFQYPAGKQVVQIKKDGTIEANKFGIKKVTSQIGTANIEYSSNLIATEVGMQSLYENGQEFFSKLSSNNLLFISTKDNINSIVSIFSPTIVKVSYLSSRGQTPQLTPGPPAYACIDPDGTLYRSVEPCNWEGEAAFIRNFLNSCSSFETGDEGIPSGTSCDTMCKQQSKTCVATFLYRSNPSLDKGKLGGSCATIWSTKDAIKDAYLDCVCC